MVKSVVKHIFDCFFSFSEPPEIRTVEGFSTVFAFVRCEHRLCSQTSRATNCATPRWVKIFNFSVKSVSGQICGQKFFAETHGGEKARTREGNGDFASFRRSACEAASASQMRRAINCATPRFIDFCKISDFEFLYFEFPCFKRG